MDGGAEAGTGGGTGAAAGGGSEAGSGEGGEGATGAASGLVDGCADLDTDGVADCETTLVENPRFTSDVDGWTPVAGATLTWDAMNPLDDLPSGSARLGAEVQASGSRRQLASQCVPVGGAKLVVAYAQALVEPAEDSEEPPRAGLEVSFFQGSACTGTVDGYFETPPSSVTGEWVTVHAGGLSKATTRSMSVALVGLKSVPPSKLDVYFDNVMLRADER